MRGYIQKRGNKYSFILDMGKDAATGKRARKRFSGYYRKKDAEKAMTQVINEIDRGTFIEPTEQTFEQYSRKWLESKKNNVRETTYYTYKYILDKNIVPLLGRKKINDIRPFDLESLFNSMKKNYADWTVFKAYNIVSMIFGKAKRYHDIRENPAELVETPRVHKKIMDYWDEDESKKFFNNPEIIKNREYIAFLLAFSLGLRCGEILGLKFSDVNFDRKELTVRRILQKKGMKIINIVKTNSSYRTISVDDYTLRMIKRQKAIVAAEKLKAGKAYHDNSLIVCTRIGTPINPSNLRRTWQKLIAISDNRYIRIHDLRHTHATLMLQQPHADIKMISERLGHKDVAITLGTYYHIMPGRQKAAVKDFGNFFFPTEKKQG